jgi:cell division ATPase FtsA
MDDFFSPISGHRVAATQQASFHSISVRELSARQKQVMACFDDIAPGIGTFTREEIAAITNMRLSSVCGRVRELLDAKRLAVLGETMCVATGKPQQLLGLPKVAA